MSIFVFDIETVPDVENGAKLLGLKDLTDEQVAAAMFAKAKISTGRTFVSLPLQKIVAISVVFRSQDQLRVWSLGELDSNEEEIISRFYHGIDKYTPTIVSWNGSGFDLPVLHYRSLLHKISAPKYWELGDKDQSFKWNNYLNRFHMRHIDLMDLLAAYQPKAFAKLDDIATLMGFPGKIGLDGSKVWDAYQNGDLANIRNYCEGDVINTYLVYLGFKLMRGELNQEHYQQEIDLVKSSLQTLNVAHFNEFLEKWNESKTSS